MFPVNVYVETLISNMTVLGVGAFGKWLGRESGALIMWLVTS